MTKVSSPLNRVLGIPLSPKFVALCVLMLLLQRDYREETAAGRALMLLHSPLSSPLPSALRALSKGGSRHVSDRGAEGRHPLQEFLQTCCGVVLQVMTLQGEPSGLGN